MTSKVLNRKWNILRGGGIRDEIKPGNRNVRDVNRPGSWKLDETEIAGISLNARSVPSYLLTK